MRPISAEKLNDAQSDSLRDALAKEFGVDRGQVSASFIGPSWGQSVSQQALRALIVFLALRSSSWPSTSGPGRWRWRP